MMLNAGEESRNERQRNRQQAIVADVIEHGTARIEALAERHGVSAMTVHRDVDALAARGIVRKSRGVVTAAATTLAEASDVFRRGVNQTLKTRIARAGAALIEPGESLILDDSTTTLALVPLLADRAPLTVLTNYLPIITELDADPDVTLIALGGEFHPWSNSFMGRMTVEAVRSIRADTFVMSTSAITDDVCFHQAQETVDTKRAMFESAARRILLVDHTKFARRALHSLAHLSEFDHVIVDAGLEPERADRLRAAGIPLTVV